MKNENQAISESLNAYLDGELDSDASADLKQQLAVNVRLQRHLYELEQIRALARTALISQTEATPPAQNGTSRWRWISFGLAASLVIGVGAVIAYWQRPVISSDDLLASLPSQAQVIRPADLEVTAPVSERRAIFHVTSANPRSVRSTLEHVEQLLRQHHDAGKSLRVEIVANADGLNALRSDTSSVREQIAHLHNSYPNIAFLACGRTLARMKQQQGIDIKLLPQVNVTSSALDQILLRLRQGWTYVRL
jgi:intracellular sulfur oxidation DsrE/DsrF family protein